MSGYRLWTPEDEARLLAMRASGMTRREIAVALGRTFRAIKRKLCP